MPTPLSDTDTPGPNVNSRSSLVGVYTFYAATVALFYAVSFFPEQRFWGINWYGFFGWPGPLALLGLGVAGWFIASRLEKYSPHAPLESSRTRYWWLAALAGFVFMAGFVLFRAETHFLGDGYQLQSWLESGVHFKTWEKGTFAVQSLLYGLVGGGGRSDAALALRLASWGSGLVCLIASAIASYLIFADNLRRLLMFVGLISGGYALLFFGYFESYPIFVATVMLFGLTGLLVATGRCNRFWILPPLILAGFFHIFAMGLVPSAAYLLLRDTPLGRRAGRWPLKTRGILVASVVVVSALILWYFCSIDYFIRFTIVPPVEDRFTVNGYTMFSLKHLLDYANLLLVLLPALPFLVWVMTQKGAIGTSATVGARFLIRLAIPLLVMVFIFNPGLGMPRDWDLFSFAGVPLTILLFYVALSGGEKSHGRTVALLSIALNLIILGPRVATQVSPEKGLAVFDSYARLDVARSVSGRFWVLKYLDERGDRVEHERRAIENRNALPQEGAVMTAVSLLEQGRVSEAKAELYRAIAIAPCYEYAWYNLGNIYLNTGQLDSALVTLRIADAMLPFRPSVYERLGQIYSALGRWDDAEKYCRKTLLLAPGSYTAMLQLVEIYELQNRIADRDSVWRLLEALPSPPIQALVDLTALAVQRKAFDEASRWLERSRRLGVDTTMIRRMEGMIPHP
jgi:Tfp pilus assembly protein PilF